MLRRQDKGRLVRRRKIKITVETNQMVIMSQHHQRIKSWCDVCNEQVEMLTIEDYESAARVVQETFAGGPGRLHFVEAAEGSVWLCLNSRSVA